MYVYIGLAHNNFLILYSFFIHHLLYNFYYVAPPRPDLPTFVRITSLGTTNLTVAWVAPSPSVSNRISTYDLVLTDSGGTTITISTPGTSYTFTGLEEYRTYTCVITSVSIYGPISVATSPVSNTTQQTGKNNY